MPIDFPDMESLVNRAKLRKFRMPEVDEADADYREAFADFMKDVDLVESTEIRCGRGWDSQLPGELLMNAGINIAITRGNE